VNLIPYGVLSQLQFCYPKKPGIGYANIVQAEGEIVYGILYQVTGGRVATEQKVGLRLYPADPLRWSKKGR